MLLNTLYIKEQREEYVDGRWYMYELTVENGELKLVFHQVESLFTIEWELLVTGKKRQPLGDGVGYNNVVAGVVVILSLVELQSCIGECCV